MLKKILVLLLVILMVVPAIVSCGDSGEEPKNTINYDTEAGGEDEETEEDPLIAEIDEHMGELSSLFSFKGKTFTWLGPSWQAPEKDEETGDAEDDAMYFRQRDIEDMFGLEWVNNKAEMVVDDGDSATIELIKQDVMAGTGAYDASYAGNMHTQQLLINDCLMNLTDFSTVDLDGEWWQQDLKGTLSIGGELYFLQGSIVSSYYQDAQCIVFNKDVAEDYGIEGLYDLARDGEWTFDKMIELANTVPENANGAGAYRYSGIHGYTVVHAHGYSITEFDEAGNPYVPDTVPQTIVDIADKYSVIFGDESQTAHTKWYSTTNYETFEEKYGYKNDAEMFADGKILFLMTNTGGGAELRTHDVNFGFLPIPKGSDAQEDYISYVEPWSAVNVFVPKSAKDPQMTDIILEAMGALGYKYFKSTCYDNMLKSRTVKDMESKEMLDIIFNTKRYDIINIVDKGASVYGDGELMNWLNGSVQETSAGMVSKYFIKSKIVNSNIKTILGNIQADINN
ncbi:MAG: hypothetical protein IKZ03_03610 [Clostridia bacterium]|nr:hypothetical protein [Clostridia bacterium]